LNHWEDNEQTALFQWAAHYKELRWLHAIPNGGKRHKKVAIKLKAQGLKSGVLDIFLPKARQGFHGLYIEMKVGKNKLTANQADFKAEADAEGYRCEVCYSWDEARIVIKDYMNL